MGRRMDAYGVYTEVMIRWMERLAKEEACVILGDGSRTMDFLFVEDVARANLAAARSSVTDDVINASSGTETSLKELASALGQVMGVSVAPEYGSARKVNTVSRRLAPAEKAEHLLGFRARVSLEEGLRQLVRWWSHERGDQVDSLVSVRV